MGGRRKRKRPTLLDVAREHEQALVKSGLRAGAVAAYEDALRKLRRQAAESAPRTQVLVRDVRREIEEFQAAVRKEFPGEAEVHAAFKADGPLPPGARETIALGRQIAREATLRAPRLIKYGLNSAALRHLAWLCRQLEDELGGPDPEREVGELAQEIMSAARLAGVLRIGSAGITFKTCPSTSAALPPPSPASTS